MGGFLPDSREVHVNSFFNNLVPGLTNMKTQGGKNLKFPENRGFQAALVLETGFSSQWASIPRRRAVETGNGLGKVTHTYTVIVIALKPPDHVCPWRRARPPAVKISFLAASPRLVELLFNGCPIPWIHFRFSERRLSGRHVSVAQRAPGSAF